MIPKYFEPIEEDHREAGGQPGRRRVLLQQGRREAHEEIPQTPSEGRSPEQGRDGSGQGIGVLRLGAHEWKDGGEAAAACQGIIEIEERKRPRRLAEAPTAEKVQSSTKIL